MMPRLQAEEDLRLVSAVAAGTGSMKREDQRSYLRALRRQAAFEQERRGSATLAELRRLPGIRVQEVPASG